MAKMKWMLAAITIVVSAGVVCAHLPSIYDARFQIDRERMRKSEELGMGLRSGFKSPAPWNREETYRGSYAIYQGDTVTHGSWNGLPLYWWAKFYAGPGEEPGTLAAGGGTSPWVLINSLSLSTGTGTYQWSGWGSQARGNRNIAVGAARVATWRNGAEGAYSFTHDDIGPMPFHLAIKPAYDLANEAGFEEIKQGWGVFVNMMSNEDWDNAVAMVRAGHEMFNHSMYHTSAADQYQWFFPSGIGGPTSRTTIIPDFDPSIPYEIRGLEVVGAWKQVDANVAAAEAAANQTLILENELVTVTGRANWTGQTFSQEHPVQVTAKSGVETLVVNGKTLYIRYDVKADLTGLPEDGSATVTNVGKIAATDVGWFDLNIIVTNADHSRGWHVNTQINDAQGNWWWALNPALMPPGCQQVDWSVGGTDPSFDCTGHTIDTPPWCGFMMDCVADEGAPGLMLQMPTTRAWQGAEFKRNMGDANDSINARIYNRINNPGIHFARGKVSEYYGYPFDAYSLVTHDSLSRHGIPQARGGSKTPQVMKGDFFHPYAIDFDAFWIDRPDWTPARQGEGWVYPDNAHVWLGLNQMVDSIVYHKGYMIREFHSVGDIADHQWFLDAQGRADQPSNTWRLNSPAAEAGGWWGGITKNQLRIHYEYMKPMIDDGRLVVFTPSEAVKYRLSANAVSSVTLNRDGNEWTLTPTLDNTRANSYMIPQQRDEITVIVGIDNVTNNQLNVVYADNPNESPRLRPRKLPGNDAAWAINFNPFVGSGTPAQPRSVRLIPNQPFTEPQWDGPNHEIGDVPCDPMDPNCNPSGTIGKMATRGNNIAFTGIHNGQINLRLAAGNYTAELYNLQGRLINRVNINAVNGVNATGLRTDNLAKGMLILNVRNAKGASVLQHKIMVR